MPVAAGWISKLCKGLGIVTVICGALLPFLSAASRLSVSPNFDVLPIEQGWQPSTVTSIIQSHEGYIWLGTYDSLLRYDGVRFTAFDGANTPGLKNGRVTALYEDASGTLWIGHETGELTRYADRQFEPVPLDKSWAGSAIECITSDEKHDLWLVNAAGVFFRLRDGQRAEPPGGGSATRKPLLVRARSGQLWVTANGKPAVLENDNLKPAQFKGTSDADYFQAVQLARDGGMWAIVNGDLTRFHDGRWEVELSRFPGANSPVTTFLETRNGTLLAGTLNDGLFVWSPGAELLHFSRTNGLSHDWVRTLCEDLEGNLWIGTGAGLDSLRARKIRMLNPPDGWQGCAVLSFTAHPDGSAWIGTEGAGLYHYEQGSWTHFKQSSGLANLFIWSVLGTQKGELYVGTWGGGLLSRNGQRFQSEPVLSTNAAVVSLYESSRGQLWVGTTEGLYRYEEGKCTWSAGPAQLASPNIRAITEAEDGTIWFGMVGGGLGSLRSGKLRQYRQGDGLSSDSVQCLLADADGTLWFGTTDNGLGCWQNGRFARIGTAEGLPSRSISHLVDDGAGYLWLGSHGGIVRVGREDLKRCVRGERKRLDCLTFGKADGLSSLTCSGGFQPGASKTADGLLWFPTSKGLAVLDPGNVTTNQVEPPVVVEDLLIDGEVYQNTRGRGRTPPSPTKQIVVAPGKKRLEIHYSGLSFAAPDKVLFRHRLEGLEPEWIDAGTRRVAEYNYLGPGKYVFRVIACNNDAVWNNKGASLTFTVLPWFYQTWWFQIGAILSGAGLVGGAARWVTRRRIRSRLEHLEQQRALERERARIARDIHDDLGASLTRISMLSQTVRSEIQGQSQAEAGVDQIYGTARELTRAMDEIVWAVNPQHDSLDSLVTYLGRFAQNFLSAAGLRCRLDVPLHLPSWSLSAEIRHNVFLAFKEALHNVVKHAQASEVRVSLEVLSNGFALSATDNGRGFDLKIMTPQPAASQIDSIRIAGGNGLENMRKRLEEVGGHCTWNSSPGEGTRVRFEIQMKK